MKKNSPETDKNRLTYFLLSRSIFDSPIWSDDPHVLKIFLYIIGTARHSKKPKRFPGFSIKRGEMVTSLTAIAENNCYMQNKVLKTMSKQKIMRILDLLQEQGYIKKLSDTYGTHLTVCNYDTYQTSKNYKSDTCGTGVEQGWNEDGTGVETYNNVNNEKNEKKKDTPKSFKQFTEDEFISKVWDIIDNNKEMKVFFNSINTLAFTDYWTEKTPSGKMLFQLKQTWDTKRRMNTWKNNNFNNNKDVKASLMREF